MRETGGHRLLRIVPRPDGRHAAEFQIDENKVVLQQGEKVEQWTVDRIDAENGIVELCVTSGEGTLILFPLGVECRRIVLEAQPPLQHLGPRRRIGDAANRHEQREAVEKLGPKLALFRVHGSDQDEARRMAE